MAGIEKVRQRTSSLQKARSSVCPQGGKRQDRAERRMRTPKRIPVEEKAAGEPDVETRYIYLQEKGPKNGGQSREQGPGAKERESISNTAYLQLCKESFDRGNGNRKKRKEDPC